MTGAAINASVNIERNQIWKSRGLVIKGSDAGAEKFFFTGQNTTGCRCFKN
jgi:hypothetical protein